MPPLCPPTSMDSSPTDPLWISLVVDVDEDHKEAICDFLLSRGAQGITEDHPGLHFADGNELYVTDEWEVPEPENPTGRVRVTAWFEDLETPDVLAKEVAQHGHSQGAVDLAVEVQSVPLQDWNAVWKEGWEVTHLTERILVVPEWLETPTLTERQLAVVLDPGMAFGTGTHETTMLCAELLQSELEQRPGISLFDVGTGTGILAVAGLLLGASSAVGCDTDPAAVQVATETAEKNGVSDRFEAVEGSADSEDATWPLVVGNLLAPLIKKIGHQLAARTAQDGALIVSGLLTRQVDEVRAALEAEGMEMTTRIDRNEWSALRFRHGAES